MIILCTIIFFFGATYAIASFIDYLFYVSRIYSDSLRNISVWNRKIVLLGSCTYGCHFICNIIHILCSWIPWILLILLFWSNTIRYNYHNQRTCVQEEPYLPVPIRLNFFPILLYHILPILLESDSIWFSASISLLFTIVNNRKKLLSNNLYATGGVCK